MARKPENVALFGALSWVDSEGIVFFLPKPIMELGPQTHHEDGLLGPNSMVVLYLDPLGK